MQKLDVGTNSPTGDTAASMRSALFWFKLREMKACFISETIERRARFEALNSGGLLHIEGFWDEAFALLGCYAAYVGSCLSTFKTNIGSILKCQTVREENILLRLLYP